MQNLQNQQKLLHQEAEHYALKRLPHDEEPIHPSVLYVPAYESAIRKLQAWSIRKQIIIGDPAKDSKSFNAYPML